MTTTRVTGPDTTIADEADAPFVRDTGGTIIQPIGPGTLDSPRVAIREAQYGNRQAEVDAVRAIDEAAFARVRDLEAYLIGRAENFIEGVTGISPGARRPGLIDASEGIVTDLNNLVTELERGASASSLAERFVSLQKLATHTALPKLSRAAREAESHLPKVQDPYAATQDAVSIMPFSSFRPLTAHR